MAQNITLLGASYIDVPGVELPKTGGGTALFTDVTDTTATASDVAQGKVFYLSDGSQATGTSTGGGGNVTQDEDGFVVLPPEGSGGGGASNLVQGTFTTGASAGEESVTVPYSGNGYPVMAVVVVSGGAYVSSSDWYLSTQRYAVGQWTMTKSVMSSSPTYTTSGAQNQGVTTWIYKNSSASYTTYSRSSAMTTNVFSSSNATGAGATCVRLKPGNVLSYYVNTSSYGLLPETEYEYFIVYSE